MIGLTLGAMQMNAEFVPTHPMQNRDQPQSAYVTDLCLSQQRCVHATPERVAFDLHNPKTAFLVNCINDTYGRE
jgi:hypothetical protein